MSNLAALSASARWLPAHLSQFLKARRPRGQVRCSRGDCRGASAGVGAGLPVQWRAAPLGQPNRQQPGRGREPGSDSSPVILAVLV